MSFYDDMASTALELLREFGQPVTLTRRIGNSIDPITGTVTAGTDASVVTTGLLKPYPDSLVDDSRVMQGDKELVLSNQYIPTMTDKPRINGEDWTIVNIKTINPSGTPVCYFVQVRR